MSTARRSGHPCSPSTRSRIAARAALAAVALVVAACAPGAPSRTEFVDALRTAGLSEADAGCVADAVLDELTEDEVALIAERGPSGAPVDDATQGRDSLERVRAAIAACSVSTAVPTFESDVAEDGVAPDGDGEDPADGADPVDGVVSPEDDPSPTAPDEGDPAGGGGTEGGSPDDGDDGVVDEPLPGDS